MLYKRFITVLLLFLLVPNVALASDVKLKKIEPNSAQQIILPAAESLDDNTYILNKATDTTHNVLMSIAGTTFTTNDYRSGYFDKYTDYTHNCRKSYFNNTVANADSITSCTINLNKRVNLDSFFIHARNASGGCAVSVNFYLNNSLVYRHCPGKTLKSVYVDQFMAVDTIVIRGPGTADYFNEFEIFASNDPYYKSVGNLRFNLDNRDVTLQYTAAASSYVTGYQILLDDELIGTNNTSQTSFKINDLAPGKYTATVRAIYDDGKYVDAIIDFVVELEQPTNVTNLSAVIANKKDIKLTYTLPTKNYSYLQIYRDNELIADNYKQNSYIDASTAYDTSYTYKIVTVSPSGSKSVGVSKTIKTPIETADNISNLTATIDGKKDVKLSYKFATDTSYVQIFRDDELLVDNYKDSSYTDSSTEYNTSYTYKIVAVKDGGIKSTGVTKTIKTPVKPSVDVSSLKATATSSSVKLRWDNPKYDIETVTIYRKQDTVMAKARALFSAGDGYTPIFTTNGTEFTDLTVAPNTSYTYKVTTTIDGAETAGITVDVKTKPVELGETTVKPDANGDYVVTWSSPTTGKMQINVGGTKYAVVPAANKTFTVPAADVKFNLLGIADIELIPLDDDGKPVGPGAKPGGGGLGSLGGGDVAGIFDAPDLLNAAVSLLALIGLFVLFGLSFRLVPKLISAIKNAFYSGGSIKK